MGDSFSMDSSWEEGAEEVKEYKCRECGKAISHSNKSGLCHSCIIKIKMKKSTSVCKIEGCNELQHGTSLVYVHITIIE